MPDRKSRILIIDDHALFREAVGRALADEPDFEVAALCPSVGAALEVLKCEHVDIVLLDINLGSEQGGAFFARARYTGFQGHVMVVTAGISEMEAAHLLERGCVGIFLKHDPLRVLIDSLHALRNGTHQLDDTSVRAIVRHIESDPGRRPLTTRERDVLRGVFGGHTNKEIANTLSVSEPLVKAVLQQLFTKTNVRTRAQLVRVALEQYWDEIENEDA